MQHSIDNTTEQSFSYMELGDIKIWISKNALLCQVYANWVTHIHARTHAHAHTHTHTHTHTNMHTHSIIITVDVIKSN